MDHYVYYLIPVRLILKFEKWEGSLYNNSDFLPIVKFYNSFPILKNSPQIFQNLSEVGPALTESTCVMKWDDL